MYCPVCLLYHSERQPGLGTQVGEGIDIAVFTMSTTTCGKSLFSEDNLCTFPLVLCGIIFP